MGDICECVTCEGCGGDISVSVSFVRAVRVIFLRVVMVIFVKV